MEQGRTKSLTLKLRIYLIIYALRNVKLLKPYNARTKNVAEMLSVVLREQVLSIQFSRSQRPFKAMTFSAEVLVNDTCLSSYEI